MRSESSTEQNELNLMGVHDAVALGEKWQLFLVLSRQRFLLCRPACCIFLTAFFGDFVCGVPSVLCPRDIT